MGYYTNFSLSASDLNSLKEIIDNADDNNDNDNYYYLSSFEKSSDGSYSTNGKWYDYEIDMCNISKKYPDVIFTLDGQGENPGDVWRKYFKDGLVSDAILSYSPFNPKYLRAPKVK